MNKKEVLELMQFVIDQNSIAFAEASVTFPLDDQQRRQVLNAVESKTKESFFRFVDRLPAADKKTKRSRK